PVILLNPNTECRSPRPYPIFQLGLSWLPERLQYQSGTWESKIPARRSDRGPIRFYSNWHKSIRSSPDIQSAISSLAEYCPESGKRLKASDFLAQQTSAALLPRHRVTRWRKE